MNLKRIFRVFAMVNNNTNHIIERFKHEPGVHCTSTALRNIFEFHGIKLSEAMIFGLGSGMGLSFGDFGGKTETIGGRLYKFENNLCKLLNVKLDIYRSSNKEEGWQRLKSMLDQGIPAAINVDMAFLKYQDLPKDFHFGQHTITVCGYDSKKSTVFIADTQFHDIKEIPLEDLHAARNYRYSRWMDPLNFIYELEFKKTIPDLKTVVPIAIQLNGKNLQKKNWFVRLFGMVNGLGAIRKFSKSLNSWSNLPESDIQERGTIVSGYISEYGTGGGLFRYLYSRFLKESAEICNNDELLKISNFYKKLGDHWNEVAIQLHNLSSYKTQKERENNIVKIQEFLGEIEVLETEGAIRLQEFSLQID